MVLNPSVGHGMTMAEQPRIVILLNRKICTSPGFFKSSSLELEDVLSFIDKTLFDAVQTYIYRIPPR